MALSTTVFKVPDWAAQGAAMEAEAEKKRKQEAEKREKLTAAMGIDTRFAENQYKLVGKYKDAGQAAFNAWKQAAVEFEMSGSQDAKSKMDAAAQQFNQAFGIGLSASATATDEMNRMTAAKGVGYIDTPDSAKEKYNQFVSSTIETKIENGVVMVKEPDGAMVPLTQSIYFQQQQNPYNSFNLDRVDPNIKFIDPIAVAQQDARNIYSLAGVKIDGATGTRYNAEAAAEKGLAQLKMRYESDPEIKRMIATRWYAQTNKLDKNRLGAADSAEIDRMMQSDPAFMEAAIQDFETKYSEGIKSQRPASQVTGGGGTRQPTDKELEREGVLRSASVGTHPHRVTGKKIYGGSFPLSNKPIKLTGADDLYITDVVMDTKGNIIDYTLYRTTGAGGIDNWENAKKELVGNETVISKKQMSGLQSELIRRGLFDNMVSLSASAMPNAAGLGKDLGL